MERYINWVIRQRILVVFFTIVTTAYLLSHFSSLSIVIDPQTMLPQSHPNVIATNKVTELFGSRHIIIIGVTPKKGDIYQPDVLEKVQRITTAVSKIPGVISRNVVSLTANKAKDILGHDDTMTVSPLLPGGAPSQKDLQNLREAIKRNPIFADTLVSKDNKTTTIYIDFKESINGFREMTDKVYAVVNKESDNTMDIRVGGFPILLSHIEIYADRALILIPITLLLISLIHLEAFRTIQGLILPLVTAFLATAWNLGIMGLVKIPLDVVTVTIPIVTVAVAAGHAVQILKRYYEEYDLIQETTNLQPVEANHAAIVKTLTTIGPVMIIAGTIASLGFFSLMIFDISTIRTLGLFAGIGILCALLLELTFIPAVRSLLPPPAQKEIEKESQKRFWDHITARIATWVTGKKRHIIYILISCLLVLSLQGASIVEFDNSVKNYFSDDFNFMRDDAFLNRSMAGTNTLYLLVEGRHDDAIKDPLILHQIDALQSFLENQPGIGRVVSIVDFIKKINKSIHNENPAYYRIPESRELISQYLLLYSMSGNPTDFDAFVDYNYRSANITAFIKSDSSAYLANLVAKVNEFTDKHMTGDYSLSIGGSTAQNAALSEVLVRDKILNILLIIAVIFTVSSIVFRSLVAGLLVVSPLIITVLANTALMGVLGIPLNIPTSISFSIIVGIGADFAIYMLYRMREQIAIGINEITAIRNVLGTAGKASLYVATAVAGGYSALMLSFGFNVHVWMGLLLVTGMLFSVFVSLTLIPATILSLRPRFIFTMEHKLQP